MQCLPSTCDTGGERGERVRALGNLWKSFSVITAHFVCRFRFCFLSPTRGTVCDRTGMVVGSMAASPKELNSTVQLQVILPGKDQISELHHDAAST